MSDDAREQARIAKFQKAAQKRMQVLVSGRASSEKRVLAARWLGESGYFEAISPLVEVYNQQQRRGADADKDLLDAVTYALGQFQALRAELGVMPGGSIEKSLEDPRNMNVVKRVNDIGLKGAFGKRKKTGAGTLWGIVGVLLVSLVLLGVMNVVLMGGDDDESGTTAPTEVPPSLTPTIESTPEVGPQGTPLPTETSTLTPTPTIAPDEVEPYVRALSNAIADITEPRGSVELLEQFWNDAANFGDTDGCNEPRPEIPSSVFVDDYYLNNIPGLREAQTNVNIALSQLNNGWDLFYEACEEGTLLEQSELGLQLVANLNNAISGAQALLRDLQQYRS